MGGKLVKMGGKLVTSDNKSARAVLVLKQVHPMLSAVHAST
jgi:hypothetical protein